MEESGKFAGGLSRLELAEQLEALASRLRAGAWPLKGRDCRVPERLEAEIKIKEKYAEVKVKVSFHFPAAAAPAQAAAADQQQQPKSFKEVKKQLGRAFGELLRAVNLEVLPQEEALERFLNLTQEFARSAEPTWADEVQDFLAHSDNLGQAFQQRQFERFHQEVRELQNRMQVCHREFK